MRIGIDARLWNETGVGRYIRNLVNNLKTLDKENEYTLFVKNDTQVSVFNNRWKIVKVNIPWHSIKEQIIFPKILKKENLDLVHFPYHSVPLFYSKPYVVTIHDLIPMHFSTGEASTLPLPIYKLKFLGYKMVISNAIIRSKKIIVPSRATKQDILENFKVPAFKIVVTSEASELKGKVDGDEKLVPNNDYFLYVGNCFPHKNLTNLVHAYKSIKSEFPKIKLFIVTKEDKFYRDLRRKVKHEGLEDYVSFYKDINDRKLAVLYKNTNALVLPSLYEGFGLPALEAMASGCLVLASDIPSLRELCGNSALYFDPKNIADLEAKMRESLTLDFDKKKKEGLIRASSFSWEKMARETLKVYESSVSLR